MKKVLKKGLILKINQKRIYDLIIIKNFNNFFFQKNFASLYLETKENSKYNYEIVKTLLPPKEMSESNSYGSEIDCFCLRWEKNDPLIAAGKNINLLFLT